MSLMSNLYVGNSGLTTAQNALNTVAHNMSNIDTDGYTRQQISLGTSNYVTTSKTNFAVSYTQTGTGVVYSECKQVRSTFLDKSYRLENGRNEFYNVSYNSINEVEDELQEMNGAEFADALSNLWSSVQNLANDPTSAVNQSTFVTRSSEFIEKAQAVYKGLVSYQSTLNTSVKKAVDTINSYGDQINTLNQQIVLVEASGVEHANDLRDQRNLLLDKLSAYGNISYDEDKFGSVTVSFEGTQFVTSDHVNHLGLDTTESSVGYYTPYWEFAAKQNDDGTLDISGAHVYDLTQAVSTEANTDVGKLRSILLSRGDHNATYHDIQDSEDYYDDNIAQSTLMNVEAEFDQLVNNVILAINNVLENASSNQATKDGTGDATDYLMFKMVDEDSTLKYDIDDDHKAGENLTGFTIANTQVNEDLLQTPTLNTFVNADDSTDQAAADALKAAFTTKSYTLNPNVSTVTDIIDSYSSLVSQVANTGDVASSITTSQAATLSSISDAREQIIGTSSDEELQYMIEFQNAYNASSRYINVINQMLEHLVTSLGS